MCLNSHKWLTDRKNLSVGFEATFSEESDWETILLRNKLHESVIRQLETLRFRKKDYDSVHLNFPQEIWLKITEEAIAFPVLLDHYNKTYYDICLNS